MALGLRRPSNNYSTLINTIVTRVFGDLVTVLCICAFPLSCLFALLWFLCLMLLGSERVLFVFLSLSVSFDFDGCGHSTDDDDDQDTVSMIIILMSLPPCHCNQH